MGNNYYTEEWLRDYQARRGLKIEIVDSPKPNKYSAIKTEVDGLIFDSRREATRYQELTIMQRQGLIRDLRLQVPFVFTHNEVKICTYVADFCYRENGVEVVEDAKSKPTKTRLYIVKRNLMKAFYGLEIREV